MDFGQLATECGVNELLNYYRFKHLVQLQHHFMKAINSFNRKKTV